MKKLLIAVLVLGFGLVAYTPASAVESRVLDVEQLVLRKINGGRSSRGLSALIMHAGLRDKGREHSGDMAASGGLNHDGFRTRIDTAIPDPIETNGAPDDGFYSAGLAGCENVAYYQPSTDPGDDAIAQKLYDLWVNSSGHANCMFDASRYGYTVAGSGVHKTTSGRWYATLEVLRDKSLPATAPTPTPTSTPTSTPSPTGTPAGSWNTVDSSSSAITYAASFSTVTNSSSIDGSFRRSRVTLDSAKHAFYGTGIRWIAPKGNFGGITDVKLDGVLVASVDTYANPAGYQQTLFERTGLSPGAHTIEIVVTGRRNSSSTYGYAYLDAFQIRT